MQEGLRLCGFGGGGSRDLHLLLAPRKGQLQESPWGRRWTLDAARTTEIRHGEASHQVIGCSKRVHQGHSWCLPAADRCSDVEV